MLRISFIVPVVGWIVSTTGAHAQQPGVGADSACASADSVDTGQWVDARIVNFALRVPPWYKYVEERGIDSVIDQWRGPHGQRIWSDYGLYGGPFEPRRAAAAGQWFTICQAGNGTTVPQIVVFRRNGEYGVHLYWPVPKRRKLRTGPRGHMLREALMVVATSPRAEDLPELLALIRSVHQTR